MDRKDIRIKTDYRMTNKQVLPSDFIDGTPSKLYLDRHFQHWGITEIHLTTVN